MSKAVKRRVAAGRALVRRVAAGARSHLLDAAGLGLLAWAAGMLTVPAGIAAAGVACLIMSWRISSE